MEKLKKSILQAVTTGITACTGTTGTCYVIIPDLTAVYHLKIGLKQESQDIGFFDAFDDSDTLIVKTGIAVPALVKSDSIHTTGNIVTKDGGETVIEYGILYTQDSSYGTDNELVYNADPAYVTKRVNSSPFVLNSPYGASAKNLTPDTLTYIRAFAKTDTKVGYGVIIEQKTDTINYYTISLSIDGEGSVTIDPPQPAGGYLEGTRVDVLAIENPPPSTWVFEEWIINGKHYSWDTGYERTIVMNSNKNVTAVFEDY